MDNNNDMKIKLKELEALLVSHDWYYMMSDENRYFKQCRKSLELITKLMFELKDGGYYTEANNLYDKYSK